MSSDPQLDAMLRDVPLPSGLVARIKSSLGPTEDELDASLRQVVLPLGLMRDLHAIPADQRLDQRLSDVSHRFELVSKLRRRSWTSAAGDAAARASQWAVALALFLAVGLALASGTLALVASIYPHALPAEEPAFIVAVNLPLAIESAQEDAGDNSTLSWPVSIEVAESPVAANPLRTVLDVDYPEGAADDRLGPVSQWLAELAGGLQPQENAVLLRFGVFGYPQYGEEVTPPLESPPSLRTAGFELPSVRGYDRLFVVRHGVFPPVNPAAHPALASIALPLKTQTDSYQLVQSLIRQGRWPAPSSVRTEDFLAAMDYEFSPARPGELAIRTAAGPSVFGPAPAGLLQLAAVAGPLPRGEKEGGHLVLAIDMSQSMARGRRLNLVRQSIEQLLARMGPRDRLSLVVFDESVRYEIEQATAADADNVHRLLADLRPAGATDLAEGLQHAAAIAMNQESGQPRSSQIVLVTDSRVVMPPTTQSLVAAVLRTAADSGVRMEVLDLGDHPDKDETLAEWCLMMHGGVHRPESADDAGWLLVEWLYGKSPVVAEESRMTLRLFPRAVAAYRLVGQEGNSLSSLRPAAMSVDLKASEVATALMEIWFQPNDEDDVGEVELAWRDPVSGAQRNHVQRISRLQFAPTWEQAPISLQQAAIAAETAEVLRGSRAALREIGQAPPDEGELRGVLAKAARVHPQLAEQPQFQAWLRMVTELSKLRP